MLKLHVKNTHPAGVEFLSAQEWYQDIVMPLKDDMDRIIVDVPEFALTETEHLRVDTAASIEDIRQLLIMRNQVAVDNPSIPEYRVTNNITRELKIEDATDNSIVLDWTVYPDLPQTEFVTWVNTTVV